MENESALLLKLKQDIASLTSQKDQKIGELNAAMDVLKKKYSITDVNELSVNINDLESKLALAKNNFESLYNKVLNIINN